MKYIILYYFIIPYLSQCFGNKTTINVLTYTFDNYDTYNKTQIEEAFRKYAKENSLNISINMEIMKFENPLDSYLNFKSLVESSLKKSNDKTSSNNNKYDLYTFSNRYTDIYAPYLLDLKKNLPKEFIEMYNSEIIKGTCTYRNEEDEEEVVGLPTYVSYEVLYSNTKLLEKYHKPIPKTWDELIDTCEHILEREKNNNTDLICYNGLFDESEEGLYSLYEFIYSCRDSFNSTYPDPHDPLFVDSLNVLKNLKEKLDADDIFKSNENFTFMKLLEGNSIFLKYWIIGEPLLSIVKKNYTITNLPGIKESISGTAIQGSNIGIIRNITDEKKEASIEVLKYYVSKENQKLLFDKRFGITAIDELLNDENSCFDEICDIVKNVQYTLEPKFIKDSSKPEEYRKRYQKYIYKFLFDNYTIDETLKQIYDITNVYYITIGTENSYVGLTLFIIFLVITAFMLLSLVFLFKDNFHPFYLFLPDDFWIVTVLGSVLLLWIPYINYGRIDTIKCHLRPLYMNVGLSLSICPIFYKLISLFPEENRVIRWVIEHRYLFLLFNIMIDVLLCSISLIKPYTPQLVSVEDGESFEKCNFKGNYTIIMLIVYKLLIILIMLFLVFVEWNISSTIYDMKFIILTLYIDILFIGLIFVFYSIKIKYYIGYFLIQSISTSAVSLFNYILLYGIRVLLAFIKKQNVKLQFINNINEMFINNETIMKIEKTNGDYSLSRTRYENEDSVNDTIESSSNSKSNFITRMINYHYTIYNNSIDKNSTKTTSITVATADYN